MFVPNLKSLVLAIKLTSGGHRYLGFCRRPNVAAPEVADGRHFARFQIRYRSDMSFVIIAIRSFDELGLKCLLVPPNCFWGGKGVVELRT